MKRGIILFLIFLLLPFMGSAGEASGYKGYVKLNQMIFGDILKPTESHPELSEFIGESFRGGLGLTGLMGFFPFGVDNGRMTNSEPNSISWLISYLVMNQLSHKISQDCLISEDPLLVEQYHSEFLSLFKKVCKEGVLTDEDYYSFWAYFHSFQAPVSEVQKWRDFHVKQKFNNKEELMKSMLMTALLNPYFFIEN